MVCVREVHRNRYGYQGDIESGNERYEGAGSVIRGQLVCVLYRYDKVRRKRYKTVELIIEEKDWLQDTPIPAEWHVYFRIGYGERELRELVKQSGGHWNPERKAWYLAYRKVLEPGLERRILDEDFTC